MDGRESVMHNLVTVQNLQKVCIINRKNNHGCDNKHA